MVAMKTKAANASGSAVLGMSEQDIDARVKLLTRLRNLLLAQRDKFRSYLRELEREDSAGRGSDVEKFEAHVQLEQSIVKDIINFRRAVEPMEELYQRVAPLDRTSDIPELKTHLELLQSQVLKRNEENRNELRQRMDDLRRTVEQLRTPYRKPSVFSSSQTGSMVDIST
ncbi:MAG TPA: hypothetical protein VMW73_17760 [Spirochaetia bacterium]|nr:hypothetical protein [Spirochaetia bacterium]